MHELCSATYSAFFATSRVDEAVFSGKFPIFFAPSLPLSLSFLCFFIHSSSGNFSDLEKHLWRWTPCRGSCVQPIYCTVPRRLHLCNERGGAKQDSAIERKRHITKSNSLESRIARNGLRQMADVSSRWRWTERPVQAEGRAVKETRL